MFWAARIHVVGRLTCLHFLFHGDIAVIHGSFEKGNTLIYTLTPNPAIDYNISCDGLQSNTVTRTRDAVYTPNGKGLNVSFTLNHYGVDTAILGFFAGFSGRYIVEGARELGVDVHPVWTEGITRVNVFLNAGPDTEYNMVNSGAAITDADERAMFELIDGLEDLDCLAISGSLPPNASEGFLRGAIERVRARGAQFVLDISSPQLADLLGLEPLLIKPNDDELRDIFGIDVHAGDEESVAAAMAELHARGAQNVLLTLGGSGAYFSNGEHIWFASRTFEVEVRSTVCAGDSSLAAFLSIWFSERDRVEDALRRSMATGANVVECAGLGDFAHVEEYEKGIEVRLVK